MDEDTNPHLTPEGIIRIVLQPSVAAVAFGPKFFEIWILPGLASTNSFVFMAQSYTAL